MMFEVCSNLLSLCWFSRYIQRNLNNAEKTQFDITSSLKAKKRKGDEEKSISSKTNGVSHSIRNKQPNNEIKFTFKNVPQSSGPNEIDKFYGMFMVLVVYYLHRCTLCQYAAHGNCLRMENPQ